MTSSPVLVRQPRKSKPSWRVYVKQFVFGVRRPTQEEAKDWLKEQGFTGTMDQTDLRVTPCPLEDGFVAELRLWSMGAEWKTEKLAQQYAWALVHDPRFGAVKVVERFSAEEKLLLSYGKPSKVSV
jgi:hypothetical protein